MVDYDVRGFNSVDDKMTEVNCQTFAQARKSAAKLQHQGLIDIQIVKQGDDERLATWDLSKQGKLIKTVDSYA